MRKTLTDRGVASLKPRPQRYAYPDPEVRGHYIRVQPNSTKSYVTVARDPARKKQIWTVIGATDVMSIDAAREKAREAIRRVRAGQPALEAPPTAPDSFEAIATQWLKRHVQAKGLRSEGEVTRLLKAHVYPRWKGRAFLDIRRSDVAALLDEVEDDHGARQADYVLAIVRGIMNWFASRHDNYVPPIVKGMRRTNPKERARERVLSDDEIRVIWKTAEANGTFGAVVRVLLLTAQRRQKVLSMRWADISIDGVWSIPNGAREKGTGGELVLPAAALDIIRAQPRIADNPYVFTGRGHGHYNGHSKGKRLFDEKLPKMAQWQLHDLRRTARSLMSRCVKSEIAEKVLGHRAQGIEAVYDRHTYRDEKGLALEKLATLIESIVNPRDNVTPLAKRRRR